MKPVSEMKFEEPLRWWPESLGSRPSAVGSANGHRYAYFAESDRLAIRTSASTDIYDTTGHVIRGVSQTSADQALVIHDTAGKVLELNRFKRLS